VRIAAALALLVLPLVALAAPVQRDHLEVELVGESNGVAPGTSAWVGLRLKHDPHWHTYWINPGDSGLPTKIAWTLPEGVTAEAIRWPAPHRISAGPLTNFGFDGEMVLPVEIHVADTVPPGTTIPLRAKASWLVCEVECIPGDAELTLDLPVLTNPPAPDARWSALFAAARAAWPVVPEGWRAELADNGEDFVLTIATQGDAIATGALEVFPVPQQLFTTAPGRAETIGGGLVRVTVPKSEYFVAMPASADIVLRTGGDAGTEKIYAITATSAGSSAGAMADPASARGDGPADASRTADSTAANAPIVPADSPSLLAALALAFVGGLLLNLMPCVFPVLALKALSLAESAHDRPRARRDGLAYLAGVVVAFVALAGLLLTLRAGGAALGWGFQLQLPWVVGALAFLMIAVGLSLSGVFEIGGAFMGAGQALTTRSGARGAFFTGLLAVVVASPCTAPFMGPALGFAITQPTVLALAVFVALALGLALPLVLISFVPALARVLPRPGAWMETLKQAMAFPMYLTALWLLWVLGQQAGVDGMTQAAAGAIALAFALWLFGRPAGAGASRIVRGVAMTAALVACIASLWTLEAVAPSATASGAHAYEPYSAERLAELRSANRPVLVNMTAAWCITCLANERVALSTDAVRDAFKQHDVVYLKGDWTNQDAAITTYLAEFGRNGVPLYTIYPRGGGSPRVLPQVLTPTLVADALRQAALGETVATTTP
jgi:thiol:disulfide interchange protein